MNSRIINANMFPLHTRSAMQSQPHASSGAGGSSSAGANPGGSSPIVIECNSLSDLANLLHDNSYLHIMPKSRQVLFVYHSINYWIMGMPHTPPNLVDFMQQYKNDPDRELNVLVKFMEGCASNHIRNPFEWHPSHGYFKINGSVLPMPNLD